METFLYLCAAGIVLRFMSFHRIVRHLEKTADSPASERSCVSSNDFSERACWALKSTRENLPFAFSCLTAALAGSYLLRRRGISFTLRLGVARDKNGRLIAHAWLSRGDLMLTGEAQMPGYSTIACFHGLSRR